MTTLLLIIAIMACDTVKVDTIASKHYDSNDPNNLPCPKGYHGVRWDGFVVDTDPPTYCYSCVKDTVVDSAPIPKGAFRLPTRPLKGGEVIPDGNLTPAELADIREMLREWRVEKCFQRARNWKAKDQLLMLFEWEIDQVRDSCECVYGRPNNDGKGK